MAKQDKLPYARFYFSDLDAEPTLKLCSWDSCWFWIKMLGLMHASPQRGYLLKANGEPYTESELVTCVAGASLERVRTALFELGANGVYSKTRNGHIYCRKIVKGELRAKNLDRDKKSKSGDKSEINSSKNGDKSDLALAATSENEKEISDSGSRTLVIPESRVQSPEIEGIESLPKKSNLVGSHPELELGKKPPPKTGQKNPSHGTRLPPDWALPKAWGSWAVEQGLSESDVRKQAEVFRDYWHAKAGEKARKADWLATWRNWIRSHLERGTRSPSAYGGKAKSDIREGKPITQAELDELVR